MRALGALSLACVALGACSLLVEFRDAPDPCADGGCLDARPDVRDDAAILDAAADAPMFDAAHICKGAYDGWYCGYNSGLNGRAPSPDHLVHCVDASAMLELCDAGCVTYPTGVPDMCNTCGNKQGFYCNGQLGNQGMGYAYLSLCNGGQMIPQMKCATKCNPGPGDAGCQ